MIKSGWSSLFGALKGLPVSNRSMGEDCSGGDQRKKLIFNIVEHFINVKSNAVFAAAAINCILCLQRYVFRFSGALSEVFKERQCNGNIIS